LVAVAREALAPLLAQWEQMLVMEDAELRDASTDWQWALVVSASGESPRPESSADCHQGALELASRGSRLIAARADVDIASFGLDELDDTQWREFRLEQLLPEFGVDFSASDRPHEASLDRRAVSWTKGCYLGQEVVCMQEMRGKVQRRLWVFSASEPFAALPEPGSDLCDASGAKVGTVTSAANSRRLGRGLLMARLETRAENGPVTLASGQPLSPLSEPVS
jgi:hypothetical protein